MTQISADIRLEHELLAVDQDHTVNVLLELRAPEEPERANRPAASCVLVVDESGSMHGAKLETARRCASWLVGRLSARDRFALCGFSREARLVRALAPLDVREARVAVASLRAHATTNLSGGLLLGLEQLRQALGDGPRVLLLLSDGLANEGITDPGTLASLATRATADGIRVSTVGFGASFDEDLLRAIADAGRGNAHYAPTPEAAPSIFATELEGLTRLAAQNLSLEVRPGASVQAVDCLNDYPATSVDRGVRLALGDVYAGEARRIVLSFHARDLRALGPCSIAELVVRYSAVCDEVVEHVVTLPVAVNLVSAAEAAAKVPDLAVREEVAVLTAARHREEAIRHADRADWLGARSALGHASADLAALRAAGWTSARLERIRAELEEEQGTLAGPATWGFPARKSQSYRAHRDKRGRTSAPPVDGEEA